MRNLRLLFILGFIGIVAMGGASAAARRQDDSDANRRAQERAEQQRAQREANEQKALRDWADRQQQQSDANLDAAIRAAAQARKATNDVKFAEMQSAVGELLVVSQRLNQQVNASGSQSISVSFFLDLDRVDKLAKRIRAAAK